MPLLQRCSSPAEGRAGHHKRSIAVLRKEKIFCRHKSFQKSVRPNEVRLAPFEMLN